MTPQTPREPIEKLLNTFFKYEELRMQAVRRLDVPAANRYLLRVSAASKALAATPDGRDELEKLLSHPTEYIRLSAAGTIMRWAPEKAIPIFGQLLVDHLSAITSVDERLDIRITAKDWLYRHFNIRSFDRNDLIEPLKAYGIDLPHRDHKVWQ
jgi:hypothetical protein